MICGEKKRPIKCGGDPDADAIASGFIPRQSGGLPPPDLGFRCLKGSYVKQDDGQAEKWFRKAAEQGNPDARQVLAERFE